MSGVPTRERMLQAATPLFAQRGYEGASTRDLVSAAGVHIAMISYHFGDKEGLYHAVLQRSYASMLALEVPALLPDSSADRVRALTRAVYFFCRERRDAVRLLLRHVLEQGSLPEAIRLEGTAQLFERLDSIQQLLGLSNFAERRLELLSLNHLVARYAVSDLADLTPFVDDQRPEDAVADHLGDLAVRLLLGEGLVEQSGTEVL